MRFSNNPTRQIIASVLPALLNVQLSSCHGYIKKWSPDDGKTWHLGQKQALEKSSIRSFSENTGWIGSNFLTNPAIVCGSGLTPSLKIVAPSGDLFSKADQSAGKTLSVTSGATIRLLINDEKDKVYPHEDGHIQVYLGYCGQSEHACERFDAATISYFKVLSLKHGLGSKKEFPYNKDKDGNEVRVPVPGNLPQGGYILRVELIAFGQSSEAEGKQDQYYITCGQIALSEPKDAPQVQLESLESVRFPGAYPNGNIDKNGPPPGPPAISTSAAEHAKARKVLSLNTTSPFELSESAPQCARSCLARKISEHAEGILGVVCDSKATPLCQCQSKEFLEAFARCSEDHCQFQESCQHVTVLNELNGLCGLKATPGGCQQGDKRKRSG